MIIASNRVEVLLASIFLSGIGGAAFLVVPMYVSEFCQESIRGGMTSFSMIFYAVGMIISYAIGGYMDYYPMVYVCQSFAVVGIALLLLLKESPLFLMKKGKEKVICNSLQPNYIPLLGKDTRTSNFPCRYLGLPSRS